MMTMIREWLRDDKISYTTDLLLGRIEELESQVRNLEIRLELIAEQAGHDLNVILAKARTFPDEQVYDPFI